TYEYIWRNHTLQIAAALSYYFVMSLFPALIFLSAVATYLPVPDVFNQSLNLMARFVPGDSMGLVRKVLSDVVTPNRGAFLSFGFLGTLWAASGGFSAAMEALNVAYEVVAVGCLIGLSYLLGVYFRSFANFNKTYGTLGAAVALMVWLYWTGFAMLVGAELNAELAKRTKKGPVPQAPETPSVTSIGLSA